MNKNNYFVIFLKKINLIINNLLKKYLNKLNIGIYSIIASSNKIFKTSVVIIILFLSYLSIPYVYNKAEIQKELENQLFDKFSLNFNFSSNLNYKFFPRPHFTVKNSSILGNKLEIPDIKNLHIFVSLNNLFSLKNIIIKDVIIENTNFYFNIKNYNFFIKLLDNDFLKKSLIIKNSKVFFQDIEDEVLFINKIIKMKFYYDPKKLKNVIHSENEIFNIPYSFEAHKDKAKNKIFSKINFNFLKLQINNELDYSSTLKKGLVYFIYNKNKSQAQYELNKNLFNFNYFDKLSEPNFFYEGYINLKPFYSTFKGNIDRINPSILFDDNSIFVQLLKTEILNNKNLNVDIKIDAKKITKYKNFMDIFINFKILEGLIDIDQTKFSWKNYVDFKISNSLLYMNENQLILDAKLFINIKNNLEIYKFLQISRSLRPKLENVEFNFNYNFDQQTVNFSNIKVDGNAHKKINESLKKIILKDNKINNKVYFRNIIKKFIKSYVG